MMKNIKKFSEFIYHDFKVELIEDTDGLDELLDYLKEGKLSGVVKISGLVGGEGKFWQIQFDSRNSKIVSALDIQSMIVSKIKDISDNYDVVGVNGGVSSGDNGLFNVFYNLSISVD